MGTVVPGILPGTTGINYLFNGANKMETAVVERRVFDIGWYHHLLAFMEGESLNKYTAKIVQAFVVPALAIGVFLMLWAAGAKNVETSLGVLPGPAKVWEQSVGLYDEHQAERVKEGAFYERMQARAEKAKAAGKPQAKIDKYLNRKYVGTATFFDQVGTSLITVMSGFILASLIAIPIGIVVGMSNTLYQAFNPIIQIFKPVSPLAWLPLVTIVVSAMYVSEDPMFEKSFVNSALVVTLCCLWPTIVNTAVGVSGVSKDLINVSRVLKLNWLTKTVKIVLPSSVPMIFTGLRLSLGIGWMVLIAAEMLAQNNFES